MVAPAASQPQADDRPPPGLQVDQDMRFQRCEWRVQRAGWAAGVFILAAALAGLFGHGPLSRAEAGSRDGPLHVRYDRIVRNQAPADLRLSFFLDPAGGETTLWLSSALVQNIELRSVMPQPLRSWSTPSRTGFVFAAPAGAAPGDRVEAVIRAEIQTIGWLRAELGVEGRDPPVHLSMLSLP